MIEKKLSSGAVLKITLAPFAEAKALYQACLEELRNLHVDPKEEVDVNLFKDLFCVGLSSKKIEAALWPCLKRATYNDLKIDDSTFEPVEARQDYVPVCFEVAKENIAPFAKSLYAEFSHLQEIIRKLKGPA
jgi:hypothetical protein